MKFRLLCIGFLLSLFGSSFCMNELSQEQLVLILAQMPEKEAKEIIYNQFDQALNPYNESIAHATRALMIEAVLVWLVTQQNPSWWRFGAYAALLVTAFGYSFDFLEKNIERFSILKTREQACQTIAQRRQQLAMMDEEMLYEQAILEQDAPQVA